MIVTKRFLPRRTFLRGMGVSVALPLLDAMVPALSAQAKTAAKPVQRLAFYYAPNGLYHPDFRPTGGETDFQLSRILSPLAAARDQMVVVTGLSNTEAQYGSSGPHTRAHVAYLNGTAPKRTEGADILSATTMDQHAAKVLGQETPLTSLELALEPSSGGSCDQGYSCVYLNTFSWRTPTTPLPMEQNPRVVFERLFGDGGSAVAQLAQMREDRSILDWVTGDMAQLQKQLGPADRLMVTEYLEAVREVERRIQKVEQHNRNSPVSAVQPLGIPDAFDDHARLMLDLQFLSYQADITRVVAFQIAREQSVRTYPWIGVGESHHNVSHHSLDPEKIAMNTKINTYHMSLFAGFVEKMRNTPDGDGSLLDHSMLLYGCGFGDGSLHIPRNMPIVIMGSGCGQLKGGRHLDYPMDTPFMNLGLSLLDKVGVHLDKLGDSTGRLVGL
jgi:hypothetical protein